MQKDLFAFSSPAPSTEHGAQAGVLYIITGIFVIGRFAPFNGIPHCTRPSLVDGLVTRLYQPARSGNDPAIPDTKHHFNSSTPFGKVKVARHQSHRLVGPLTLLQFSTTGFEVLQLGEENGISKLEEFLHPAGSRG